VKYLANVGIPLVTSTITSWFGALLDHGDWWGVTSTIFGVIGIFIGIWIRIKIADYIEG
jgi:hypothetical protein